MQFPHKIVNTMKYTEVVFYDTAGNEIGRERNYDDWTHDSSAPQPLTEQEVEDLGIGGGA